MINYIIIGSKGGSASNKTDPGEEKGVHLRRNGEFSMSTFDRGILYELNS